MKRLFALLGASVLGLSAAAACSGDDDKVARAEAGAAGEAGSPSAPTSGGSQSQPGAGGAGAPASVVDAGAGGTPASNEAGATSVAGAAQGGADSLPMAGAGGAAGVDCPAQVGNFTYSCATVEELWSPTYDPDTGTFHFDVSPLPFPIASGTATVSYNGLDATQCTTPEITVTGNDVAVDTTPTFAVVAARVMDFHFVDVCGNHHDYDAVGAPNCYDLRGAGEPTGAWDLACAGYVIANCPATCD